MLIIIGFFLLHWYASVFAQSFFLHRYMAHRMFTLSPFWEKFFYLFTFLSQGSSFLHPKSYAQLHLEHHKHSDTEDDPHSPHFFEDVFSMMVNTKNVYMDFKRGDRKSSSPYIQNLPVWNSVDQLGNSHTIRLLFCAAYAWIYFAFAPSLWLFLLLPIHFLMGPIHGAFVNWCGHKYGYRNYKTKDESRNTFPWDILFVGETFQNNHHKYPNRLNFATRWYELDFAYPVIWLMSKVGIVHPVK
ncbi:acyl-CoA desaturase [Puniceicoccaceae bacterium K14]|nr:acyl-CoA desaturase [Puniceicoccaceae bacterium K14]